jgi:hypothetical protein
MTGLLVKCLVLIALIHGLRQIGRRIGPRASGLILGLPSSTAILLVLCGWEKGSAGASEMAEASLLGLVAAVALPLAYARSVRRGWPLAGAMAAALASYLLVASVLGYLRPTGVLECLAIALGAIVIASCLAGRIRNLDASRPRRIRSARWPSAVRTSIPAAYVILAAMIGRAASPSWAGLVSTFPSMSLAILAVTHLEEGPSEASAIARTLPLANLSTAAFLAVFRTACPALGLGLGTFWGYVAALLNTAAIELVARRAVAGPSIPGDRRRQRGSARAVRPSLDALLSLTTIRSVRWRRAAGHSRVAIACALPDPSSPPGRAAVCDAKGRGPWHFALGAGSRLSPRSFGRLRPAHRKPFAPLLEMLPC